MTDKELLQITIGKRIRKLRLDRNMALNELAAHCNIEKSNFSRIESGRTNPTIYTLKKISDKLGIALSELVELENE